MIPFKIDIIDFTRISEKEYFYNIKKNFLLNDFRYKEIESEPKLDLEQNQITIFKGDYNEEKVEELIFDFFEDYLKNSAISSVKEYQKSFVQGLETIKNYTPEAKHNHFIQHEVTIKAAISSINSISILKTNKFNEFLESQLQILLDEINSIKQDYTTLPKIHLNLNKVQALLLFEALLENKLIVGVSTSELFRKVEDYFTYRDAKEDKPILQGRKALSDYKTSQKNVSFKALSELEGKLGNVIDYLEEKFGEK